MPQQGTLAGEKLASGLTESAKLIPAIFSPATKAETGHDENITVARMREVVGNEVAYELESMARAVYTLGEKIARDQGIIIADTKFEFGRDADGRIILIDEVMTPDSSRFWAADVYQARPAAAELRQAAAARLSRRRAPRRPLERRRATAAAAGRAWSMPPANAISKPIGELRAVNSKSNHVVPGWCARPDPE